MSPNARIKTLTFFVFFLASGFSAEAVEIHLKSRAYVGGAIVRLGDLAEVKNADLETTGRLQRIELFPAPPQGKSRWVKTQEIRELLALNGFTGGTYSLLGSRLARVYPLVPVPAAPVRQTETRPVKEEAQPELTEVVVAVRSLNRGDVVRPNDVAIRSVPATLRGVTPIRQPQEVFGMEVTKTFAEGTPLDTRFFKQPLLVHRNDMVTVYARASGVIVRASAKALQDGSLGELVTLEALGNRRRYSARVTGIQEAEVYASGIQVDATSRIPSTLSNLRR